MHAACCANFPDTADLLGWYEVIYQDGFVETVPVRFGWNILPVTWGKQSGVVAKGNAKELSYAYAADAIPCGLTNASPNPPPDHSACMSERCAVSVPPLNQPPTWTASVLLPVPAGAVNEKPLPTLLI